MTQKKTENNTQNKELRPLRPMDVGICDYHTFKAQVAHPVHGRPCIPLICTIVDVATRVVVGWAVGTTETGQIVNSALKDPATVNEEKPWGGVFSILHLDNHLSNKATGSFDEVMDVFTRIGTTAVYPAPGSPQGCGLRELLRRLWALAAADLTALTSSREELFTYVMSEISYSKQPAFLPSWSDFMDICYNTVENYNYSPNPAFPDPNAIISQQKFFYTPNEQWDIHVSQGWDPEGCQLTEGEVEILFLPRVVRKVHRSCVKLFTNAFYNKILERYEGEKFQIGYDVNDGEKVSVWDSDGRLVCYAKLEEIVDCFFPAAEIDNAVTERAKRRNKIKLESLGAIEIERRDLKNQ